MNRRGVHLIAFGPSSTTWSVDDTALADFKGAKDGTHHILYELKVVNPCSSDDAGTGALGGAVAFGNTADGLYNDILGKPATANADRVPCAYDTALRKGHSVIPVASASASPSVQAAESQ